MTLVPEVIELLAAADAADVPVFIGGIIPDADIIELKKCGVAEVFTPGTPIDSIVQWLSSTVALKN